MNGLILIGGKGTRLGGVDKSLLFLNNQTQRTFLQNLLKPYCSEVYFSCRQDQMHELNEPLIVDPFEQGPLGGILSALETNITDAWLVVACDMPNLTPSLIQQLVAGRDKEKMATAFFNTAANSIEPLLAIYENTLLDLIRFSFQNGQRSPIEILKNATIQQITVNNFQFFKNVNSIEDLQ